MSQRRQLPPHSSMQERAHALTISHSFTVVDLTHTINRDLMVGKRPEALITTFFTKRERKGNLYIRYFFNKVRLVQLIYE